MFYSIIVIFQKKLVWRYDPSQFSSGSVMHEENLSLLGASLGQNRLHLLISLTSMLQYQVNKGSNNYSFLRFLYRNAQGKKVLKTNFKNTIIKTIYISRINYCLYIPSFSLLLIQNCSVRITSTMLFYSCIIEE